MSHFPCPYLFPLQPSIFPFSVELTCRCRPISLLNAVELTGRVHPRADIACAVVR